MIFETKKLAKFVLVQIQLILLSFWRTLPKFWYQKIEKETLLFIYFNDEIILVC